jgi:hypothetical protein
MAESFIYNNNDNSNEDYYCDDDDDEDFSKLPYHRQVLQLCALGALIQYIYVL